MFYCCMKSVDIIPMSEVDNVVECIFLDAIGLYFFSIHVIEIYQRS